jgi:hypothetical protein
MEQTGDFLSITLHKTETVLEEEDEVKNQRVMQSTQLFYYKNNICVYTKHYMFQPIRVTIKRKCTKGK